MKRTEALVGGSTTDGVFRKSDCPIVGTVRLEPANLGKPGRVAGNKPDEDHAAGSPGHRADVAVGLRTQNRTVTQILRVPRWSCERIKAATRQQEQDN